MEWLNQALATATAGYAASRAHNESTIPVGDFADVPALTFDTCDDPCVTGQKELASAVFG